MPRSVWLASWLLIATLCFAVTTLLCPAVVHVLKRNQPEKLPLHQQIDQLIEQNAVGPQAAVCSDADFVRRVWLDLAGMIPTADETRAFLADQDADKRTKLIDRLLASPQFSRHMTSAAGCHDQ